MNADDHHVDVVAALRQPALPAERAGEAAAIASMASVLAASTGAVRRRRAKGAAIVIVTAASLGVGGLAAAGPGFFPSVFDQPNDPELIDDGDRQVELPEAVTENAADPAATGVVPGGDSAAVPGVSPAQPDMSTETGRRSERVPAAPRLPDTDQADTNRAEQDKCADPPSGPTANAAPDQTGPPAEPGQRVPDVAIDCATDGNGNPGEPEKVGKPADPGTTSTNDQPDRPGKPDTPDKPGLPDQPGKPSTNDDQSGTGQSNQRVATESGPSNGGQPAEPAGKSGSTNATSKRDK